jgi:hypothetical protein
MTLTAKIIAAIVVVSLILTSAGLYSLPYVTLYEIKEAVEHNNSGKLKAYIDFESVRRDLKDQIRAFLATKLESVRKSNQVLELLGADIAGRLADKMVDKVIDTAVTPEGLDELMRGKIIAGQITSEDKQPEGTQPPDVSLHYETWSKFVAEIRNKSEPNKKVKLILTRQGLDWKLTAVSLPLDSIPWPNLTEKAR